MTQGPLAGLNLARNKQLEEEEKRLMAQQGRMQHLQQARQQQGPLGQLGNQVKGQVLGKAAGFITKSLFGFENGGQPMQGADQIMQMIQSAPPEIQQAIEAFLAGQMDLNTLAYMLNQAGMEGEQLKMAIQVLKQMKTRAVQQGAPEGPHPQQFRGGGAVMPLSKTMSYIMGGLVHPESKADAMMHSDHLMPSRYEDGGSVEAMAVPAGGPIKSVKQKKKKVMGHNSEDMEMSIEFDTKAMSDLPMPPISSMAKKHFGMK